MEITQRYMNIIGSSAQTRCYLVPLLSTGEVLYSM